MWREPSERRSSGHDRRRRDDAGGFAGEMARLFGQMMLLPLTTFVYAVEAFARALRDVQQTGDRAVDAFAGRELPPFGDEYGRAGPAAAPPAWGDAAAAAPAATDYAALNVNAGVAGPGTNTCDEPTETEERDMTEHDMRGDDLKLVRFTISFTKRDKEVALTQGIDMINYSTTLGDYQGAKRDEFLRRMRKDGIERQKRWIDEKYPADEYLDPNDSDRVIDLPADDIDRFLRVFVEILTKYEKQDRDYKKVKVVQD